MSKLIAQLKNIALYALPFILLDVYVSHYYSVRLHQIAIWWADNWRLMEHFWGITFFASLALFFSAMLVTSMALKAYLYLFGEDHRLIYVGNTSENMAEYQFADHKHQPPVVAKSPVYFNTTFKRLYSVDHFRKDRGVPSPGISKKSFHPFSLLSLFFLSLGMLTILVPLIHVYAYPPGPGTEAEDSLATMDSLERLLEQWHLSPAYLVFTLFAAFIVGALINAMVPHKAEEAPIQALPGSIRPRAKVLAKPVGQTIVREYSKSQFDSERRRRRRVDTGYRYATFRFADGFHIPVYVSVYYHRSQYPGWEEKVEQARKRDRPLQLEITRDLGIQPAP